MVLASLATTVPRSFLDSLEILFFLLHLVEGVLLEALIFLLSFLLKTLDFLLSEFGMCTIARRIDGIDGSLHLVNEFVTSTISLFPTSSIDCHGNCYPLSKLMSFFDDFFLKSAIYLGAHLWRA